MKSGDCSHPFSGHTWSSSKLQTLCLVVGRRQWTKQTRLLLAWSLYSGSGKMDSKQVNKIENKIVRSAVQRMRWSDNIVGDWLTPLGRRQHLTWEVDFKQPERRFGKIAYSRGDSFSGLMGDKLGTFRYTQMKSSVAGALWAMGGSEPGASCWVTVMWTPAVVSSSIGYWSIISQ